MLDSLCYLAWGMLALSLKKSSSRWSLTWTSGRVLVQQTALQPQMLLATTRGQRNKTQTRTTD